MALGPRAFAWGSVMALGHLQGVCEWLLGHQGGNGQGPSGAPCPAVSGSSFHRLSVSFPPLHLAPAGPCRFILLKQMVLNALTLKNTSGFPSHKSNTFAVETSGNREKEKKHP